MDAEEILVTVRRVHAEGGVLKVGEAGGLDGVGGEGGLSEAAEVGKLAVSG